MAFYACVGLCRRQLQGYVAGCVLVASLVPACTSVALGQTVSPRPLGSDLPVYSPNAGRQANRDLENPTGKLSLRDVLALALMQNADLSAFAWEVRAREARTLQAGRPPNPVVSVLAEDLGGSSRNTVASTGTGSLIQPQTTIQLSQLVELGGKRGTRRRIADLKRELAAWDYEMARIDVFTRVARTFTDVLASQEAVALSEQTMRVVEKVQQSVEQRVAAGVVSPIEQTKAEVALAGVRIESDRARRQLDADRRRLAVLWGSSVAKFDSVVGDLTVVSPVPQFTDLQARLSQNPELARWVAEILQREAALALERSKRVPDVSVTAGYRRFNQIDGNSYLIGGSIQIPLFDRNRGAIQEVDIRVSKAREEQRAAEARVTAALAEAYRALATAKDEVSALSTKVMPGARSAFEAVSEGYRLGKFGYLEVLDAQRTLVMTGGQYLRALADYHKAMVEVERLIGAPLTDVSPNPPTGIQ